MFNRKTLFIVGAGAGVDIDLPVGRALAENIAKITRIGLEYGRLTKQTVDEDLALSFFERALPDAAQYLDAFHLIHEGIFLANSIDDFLNIHEASKEVVTVGKASIIRSILQAEHNSKLWVNPSNANKLDFGKVSSSWFVKFMQVLGPGRKLADVDQVFNDVSFVTFNYDRCLEFFLIHSLQRLYGIQRQRAVDLVERATIIHPYGSIGALDKVPFGGQAHGRLDYRDLSSAIKTYTERVEEQSTLDKIESVIGRADCIVFLGFAYHSQNMELLFKSLKRPKKTVPIYGTAFGMSDADRDQVESQLADLFPDVDEEDPPHSYEVTPRLVSTDHIHLENKLGCKELFDYYAKSIAG